MAYLPKSTNLYISKVNITRLSTNRWYTCVTDLIHKFYFLFVHLDLDLDTLFLA